MAARGVNGEQPRVAVVGAGLAGLSATVALARSGAHVEVFERSRLLGGKATSFVVDGVEVDNGQHVTLGCCTAFAAFVRGLGMERTLHMQSRFDVTVLRRGAPPARLVAAPLPAPLHLASSFLGYGPLRWRDKAHVARALLAARGEPRHDESMAAWLARHGQRAATRSAFWDPFLVPALNASLEDVAAADGLFVIRTAFLGRHDAARIGYTTVPLARIAEAAAARATAVHVRSPVSDVDVSGGSAVSLRTDAGTRTDFDAYVLAVPPHRLASLLRDPRRAGIHGLDGFRTRPIVDVHLWYSLPGGERVLGTAGFAALLDSPVQWVFEKAPGYLCCSLSAAGEQVARPERELIRTCHEELAAVLPSVRELTPARGAATRDPDATFLPAPGLRRPGAATALRNVVLAGAWTDTGWPATMESAVRSGILAARLLRARLAAGAGTARVRPLADAV